jgi:hypothetical protein
MQAAIASLFEKSLDKVPNFIEFESYFPPLHKFILENGYEYHGTLFNKNYSNLLSPTDGCFNVAKWYKPYKMTKKRLYNELGVNGYFCASVLSPKYFNWHDGRNSTHAVIIDKDYNIVHDVNPEYQKILQYPLSDILRYNGIIDVYIINPKEEL